MDQERAKLNWKFLSAGNTSWGGELSKNTAKFGLPHPSTEVIVLVQEGVGIGMSSVKLFFFRNFFFVCSSEYSCVWELRYISPAL